MVKMAVSTDFSGHYKMGELLQHSGRAAMDKRMVKVDSLGHSTSSGCSGSALQAPTERQKILKQTRRPRDQEMHQTAETTE